MNLVIMAARWCPAHGCFKGVSTSDLTDIVSILVCFFIINLLDFTYSTVLTVYYLTEWKLCACKGFFSSSCV